MIEKLLATCLQPILEAETRLRCRRVVIGVLVAGAVGILGLFALAFYTEWWSWPVVLGWFGVLAIAAAIGLTRAARQPDLRALARKVEEKHPDLRSALLAAMDQKPGPDGELSYLQRRLLSEVSEHAVRNRWVRKVSERRLFAAGWGQLAAVAGFCLAVWTLLGVAPGARQTIADAATGETGTDPDVPAAEISVSPGDVEVEKGDRLVVEATFTRSTPSSAMLVVTNSDGEKRVPMLVGLDDSVFSALLPKVDLPGTYHVAFGGNDSEEFAITVFEFPALEQADATVTPPAYLGKEPETIIDTRKITVMEGSTVEWQIRTNKPVALAELFGEDQVSLPLEPDANDPHLLRATHVPKESQRYRLHLVDDANRANKRPPWLTVNVKRNEPPEIKLTFPGRDFEVSAVQELPVEAEIWDETGIEAAGFAYQFGDEETVVTIAEDALAGGKKHPIASQIDVAKLDAEARDLITYYFWAEDRDAEGALRRTTSDMFFAEVRFFDEIIREGQPGGGQGGGQQGQSEELLKIQKDIINAAWKLRRYHDLGREFDSYGEDLGVVIESQLVAISQTDQVISETDDPELKQIFTEARELMDKAAGEFALAGNERDGALIAPAHQTARAVFAKLIEARARESQISMQREPSQGQSQQREQTNMNLELEQKELKYEENSVAQQEQMDAEQQENLAVLALLKELARRQEAIAEKIKELEELLQDANEEERAEIERQLKRLQEEQRELLRETDELSERMDSEENRANMAEEREQLEETRENIREASEKLEEGELADAANSATRAQRELEEMEEEFRERTSNQFAEEMRGVRDKARELAENQQALGEQLEEMTSPRTSQDPFEATDRNERMELAQKLAEQGRELSDLVEEMKQLSEESEESEPLLSDALYEAVRETMTGGVQESLDEARDYAFYDRPNQALGPQQAAQRGIEELKERVEAAAEKVLGNEADSLRMARSELDRLIEDAKAEAERLAGGGEQATPSEETGSQGEEGEPRPGDGKGQLAEQGEKGKGEKGETPGSGEQAAENESEKGGKGEKGETPGNGEQMAENESENGGGKRKGQQPGENPEGEPSPGEGQGKGEGETPRMAAAGGETPGQQPGRGGSEGEGETPSDSPGEKGQGKGKGKGENPSEGEGEGQGQGESETRIAGSESGGQRRGSTSTGGDDRGGGLPTDGQVTNRPLFFTQQSERREAGPITGEDYKEFRDRLGSVEEMLPTDDLRDEARRVADDARQMRIDYSRNNDPPAAGTIDQRIVMPLVELRQRVSEEIAKLNRENPISPVDRDPVPAEFRDLVRRYYEELGAGN